MVRTIASKTTFLVAGTDVMFFEEINQLLKPGYLPLEIGYRCLPNGQICIAVLTRMPGCKGKWLHSLFSADQPYTFDSIYKDYSRNDISIGKDLMQIMQKYIKNGFFGRNILEGKLLNYKVVSEDPSQIFEIPALIQAGVTMVFYAKSYLPNGKPEGRIIHLARDTNYGCELRSRFWLYNTTEESAQIRLEHYISEHGYLADSMKKFIEEYLKLSHKKVVNCKFCASSNVAKNGTRAGTQYWRCKECGRGFVDNTCLPKMKYSFSIVGKAVYDYCNGKSISNIRKDINKKYQLFPSDSTILGWIRKLTKITYNDYKINTELRSDITGNIVATSSQIESRKDI